jgi:hypothetical protein
LKYGKGKFKFRDRCARSILALSQSGKEEFLANNIDYIGGLSDIADKCFKGLETTEFLELGIDKISNDALLAEVERRGLN